MCLISTYVKSLQQLTHQKNEEKYDGYRPVGADETRITTWHKFQCILVETTSCVRETQRSELLLVSNNGGFYVI